MENPQENPSPHKGLKKGLYLVPSAFTAANIAMGFLAVIASLRAYQIVFINPAEAAMYFGYAAKAIGLAILFDTLDGRVARMTRTTTEIGVQLDSFADVLTFGVAPIVLVYSWAIGVSFNEGSSLYALGVFVLFMYLMCGAFRLARFNIQATRPRVLKEGAPKVDKKNFVGLPIPPAAGLLAAIINFAPYPLNSYEGNAAPYYAISVMVLIGTLGLLMVSTLRYSSFKNAGSGRRSLYLILVIAAIGMLIWLYSRYTLLILAAIYVSHGVIWYLISLLRPSRKEAEVARENLDTVS